MKQCKYCDKEFIGKSICCSRSCASKLKWTDISFRNKTSKTMKETASNPEEKKKIS